MRPSRPLLLTALAALALPLGAAAVTATHSMSAAPPTPHGTPSRDVVQPRNPAPPPADLAPDLARHQHEPPQELVRAREHDQAQDDRGAQDQPAPDQ